MAWVTVGYLSLSIGTAAFAHDIWTTVDKKSDGKVVADIGYGDRDDRSVPDPEKLVVMDLIGPAGTTQLRQPMPKVATRLGQPVIETTPFSISEGSIIALTYDNGFWVKIPGDKGETNTTTLLSPKGTAQHWTVKFSKMLYGAGAYKRKTNQRVELTALKDPFTLASGEKLPVRVEYEGQPIAGTEVQYDDGISPISDAKSPKVKTGSDGVALIPITRAGPYLLSVDFSKPPIDKRFADFDHLFGSLSFDLKK